MIDWLVDLVGKLKLKFNYDLISLWLCIQNLVCWWYIMYLCLQSCDVIISESVKLKIATGFQNKRVIINLQNPVSR